MHRCTHTYACPHTQGYSALKKRMVKVMENDKEAGPNTKPLDSKSGPPPPPPDPTPDAHKWDEYIWDEVADWVQR